MNPKFIVPSSHIPLLPTFRLALESFCVKKNSSLSSEFGKFEALFACLALTRVSKTEGIWRQYIPVCIFPLSEFTTQFFILFFFSYSTDICLNNQNISRLSEEKCHIGSEFSFSKFVALIICDYKFVALIICDFVVDNVFLKRKWACK